jgi:hypothetical protein
MGSSHVFILRIWKEGAESHEPGTEILRGSVQRVSNGELRYFSRLEQLSALVARLTTTDTLSGKPESPGYTSNQPGDIA